MVADTPQLLVQPKGHYPPTTAVGGVAPLLQEDFSGNPTRSWRPPCCWSGPGPPRFKGLPGPVPEVPDGKRPGLSPRGGSAEDPAAPGAVPHPRPAPQEVRGADRGPRVPDEPRRSSAAAPRRTLCSRCLHDPRPKGLLRPANGPRAPGLPPAGQGLNPGIRFDGAGHRRCYPLSIGATRLEVR